MKPYYADEQVQLYHGKAEQVLPTLPDASVDAVCTDPPYELSFMGRSWDASGIAYSVELWREVLRVLKPGGHLLAFGGTRTVHRLTCAIEDAGFEIRDGIDWLYASGFSKSWNFRTMFPGPWCECDDGALRDGPVCARCGGLDPVYRGFGTGLKPSREPIVVARKPLAGTVAGNVLAYGTGALNIDGCRVAAGQDYRDKCASVVGLDSNRNGDAYGEWTGVREDSAHTAGRWPSNLVLSHAGNDVDGDLCTNGCVEGCPVAELDRQSGVIPPSFRRARTTDPAGATWALGRTDQQPFGYGDSGAASRFFPVFRFEAKAPASERPRVDGVAHETVKPLDLMRWLVRLVTPPGGLVLDMFAGSGTTAEACLVEGFRCLLVERDTRYLPLIKARLSKPIAAVLPLEVTG